MGVDVCEVSEARELLEDPADPLYRLIAEMAGEAAERRSLRIVTGEEGEDDHVRG